MGGASSTHVAGCPANVRHLQGDVGGSLLRATSDAPAEQGLQTDVVIDEDLRQLLVEVVKEGQRQAASWCWAWRHVTEVGSRDPGSRSADFLGAFLHKRVAGPRRPRPWLVNYRGALRAAGVDELLGTTRSARARSEAAPALGRPMGASTPEGAGEQGCAATSTYFEHAFSARPRLPRNAGHESMPAADHLCQWPSQKRLPYPRQNGYAHVFPPCGRSGVARRRVAGPAGARAEIQGSLAPCCGAEQRSTAQQRVRWRLAARYGQGHSEDGLLWLRSG